MTGGRHKVEHRRPDHNQQRWDIFIKLQFNIKRKQYVFVLAFMYTLKVPDYSAIMIIPEVEKKRKMFNSSKLHDQRQPTSLRSLPLSECPAPSLLSPLFLGPCGADPSSRHCCVGSNATPLCVKMHSRWCASHFPQRSVGLGKCGGSPGHCCVVRSKALKKVPRIPLSGFCTRHKRI